MEKELTNLVLLVVPVLIGLVLASRGSRSIFPPVHPKHTTDAAKEV